MTSTNFTDKTTIIASSWLNDVDDHVYGDYADISVKADAYGAKGDGTTDDTAAIDAAKAAAAAAGKWLVFPKGSYKYSGTVYDMTYGQGRVLNRGYSGGYSPVSQARNTAFTIIGATPATSPQVGSDSRLGISITMQAFGSQHSDCMRANLYNSSDDGNGCTVIYAHAESDADAQWTAGYHVETRHGGGGTHGINIEVASYEATGNVNGIVVHNATATTGQTTHTMTGAGLTSNPNMTGIYILGNNNTDPKGGWTEGIEFSTNSMRAGGVGIIFNCNAAVEALIKSSTSSASATADILLQGNSSWGIILNGTYTNGAVRVADDQYIGLRTNGVARFRYVTGSSEWEFSNSTTQRFSVKNQASPYITLNGVQVLGVRQTGWTAWTGTKNRTTKATGAATLGDVAQTLGALLDDLISHGVIGT